MDDFFTSKTFYNFILRKHHQMNANEEILQKY